jgi:hypothetical protein
MIVVSKSTKAWHIVQLVCPKLCWRSLKSDETVLAFETPGVCLHTLHSDTLVEIPQEY